MTLGLNLISPLAGSSSSSSTDQANATGGENAFETSGTNNATAAEPSSGASQSPEAKSSQIVQPLSTDVAVTGSDKPGVGRSVGAADQSDFAARQFAIKARAESIVDALIDAISAPIQASEVAAVEAAEAELKAGEAKQAAVQQPADRFEGGLGAVRTDS